VSEEAYEHMKSHFALAVAQGISAAAWARDNHVSELVVGEWSSDEEVRKKVETYRRDVLDQVVGGMNKLAPWVVEQLAKLARTAVSETVRLRSLRAIVVDMMAVSRYAGLEFRMTAIEEKLAQRAERDKQGGYGSPSYG
jgi:hypothetical protein